MPTTTTTDILQAPVILTHDGATYYFGDAVEVVTTLTTSPVESDMFGTVDEVVTESMSVIRGTPLPFNATSAAKLWPYGNAIMGSFVCGDTDKPLVLVGRNGKKLTFGRAALTQMPALNCSVSNALIGQAQWTAIREGGVALEEANSIFTWADQAFSDTSFNPAQVLRGPYTIGLGALTPIRTEGGIQLQFGVTLQAERTDEEGTYDWTFQGVTLTASMTPVGVSLADWQTLLKAQGAGVAIGARVSTLAAALSVAKTGFALSVPKAYVREGTSRHGAKVRVPGPLSLQAVRTVSAGAQQPLFTLVTGAWLAGTSAARASGAPVSAQTCCRSSAWSRSSRWAAR